MKLVFYDYVVVVVDTFHMKRKIAKLLYRVFLYYKV